MVWGSVQKNTEPESLTVNKYVEAALEQIHLVFFISVSQWTNVLEKDLGSHTRLSSENLSLLRHNNSKQE